MRFQVADASYSCVVNKLMELFWGIQVVAATCEAAAAERDADPGCRTEAGRNWGGVSRRWRCRSTESGSAWIEVRPGPAVAHIPILAGPPRAAYGEMEL